MTFVGRPRDDFERELFPELDFLLLFAKKLTRNAEDGEDLFGTVVVKLLANKASYRLGSSIRSWACFIMKNQFYSDRRRAWRSVEWDDEFDRTLPARDDPAATLEFKEALAAMAYLPPEMVETMRALADGMTYEEIAAEESVEVGTVKSRASRGRQLFRRYFDE